MAAFTSNMSSMSREFSKSPVANQDLAASYAPTALSDSSRQQRTAGSASSGPISQHQRSIHIEIPRPWQDKSHATNGPRHKQTPMERWVSLNITEEPWNAIRDVSVPHHIHEHGDFSKVVDNCWSLNAKHGSETTVSSPCAIS